MYICGHTYRNTDAYRSYFIAFIFTNVCEEHYRPNFQIPPSLFFLCDENLLFKVFISKNSFLVLEKGIEYLHHEGTD